ncbi:MAG: FAD binding domain-containing protein [Burkholderiales bacterium]|nr:FAD binding domain-containing protein [Burkholderiales bacterium]
MILFDFGYERASSAQDAVARLARLGGDGRLLAGGTDLVPSMRSELAMPATLISLKDLAPEAPRLDADGSIRIDALTRLADLERANLIRERLPMLALAARAVGGNQIREMGTLGGNLCQETRCLYLNQRHDYQFAAPCFKRGGECCYPFPRNKPEVCWSVHMSDIAPALVALDASVEILGVNGTRRAAIEELYSGSGLRPLNLDYAELVRAVTIPPLPARWGWGFHKSSVRGGLEFGMAVCAVSMRVAAGGETCAEARIALGAVRERPVRAPEAEDLLAGAAPDDARLALAAAAAAAEANPLPHHGFTKRHLTDNLKVYLRRTLEQALERARGKERPC